MNARQNIQKPACSNDLGVPQISSEPRASGCLASDGKIIIFIILIAVVNPISCLSLSSSCFLEACNAFANSRSSSSSCQLSG